MYFKSAENRLCEHIIYFYSKNSTNFIIKRQFHSNIKSRNIGTRLQCIQLLPKVPYRVDFRTALQRGSALLRGQPPAVASASRRRWGEETNCVGLGSTAAAVAPGSASQAARFVKVGAAAAAGSIKIIGGGVADARTAPTAQTVEHRLLTARTGERATLLTLAGRPAAEASTTVTTVTTVLSAEAVAESSLLSGTEIQLKPSGWRLPGIRHGASKDNWVEFVAT